MVILSHERILLIIERLAIEILENNAHQNAIVLVGINTNGYRFARLIYAQMKKHTVQDIRLNQVRLRPQNPISEEITLLEPIESEQKRTIILVDDVANTGRTLFYASLPVLDLLPQRLEAVVLVDRKHKDYPMHVHYVGLSLATTLKENIEVDLSDENNYEAVLA